MTPVETAQQTVSDLETKLKEMIRGLTPAEIASRRRQEERAPLQAELVKARSRLYEAQADARLSDADEAKIARDAQLEAFKQPLPPEPEVQFLQRQLAQKMERDAQHEREERAKRPTPAPPRQPVDFVQQQHERIVREQRHERIKSAVGGRLE